MDIQKELAGYKIIPDPMKDQFSLTDEAVISKIVEFADLKKSDVVLEVGSGTGNLTCEIAKKAGRVIAFEFDKRFKPFLDRLPKNVEVHYEDAWNYIQLHGKFRKKKEYNKVVANPPFSLIEPFLHNLTFLEYDKVILLVPLKILKKMVVHRVFGSFFKTKIFFIVPKKKFYPLPRSNSAVIDLVKLPDPVKTKNLGLYLRQYIYQHEEQLVKNSLMDGLVKYEKLVNLKKLSKNQAREIISEKKLPEGFLQKRPEKPVIYDLVEKSFRTKL